MTDAHIWRTQARGGRPDDSDSRELVRFCRLCGAEDQGEEGTNPPCLTRDEVLAAAEAQEKVVQEEYDLLAKTLEQAKAEIEHLIKLAYLMPPSKDPRICGPTYKQLWEETRQTKS